MIVLSGILRPESSENDTLASVRPAREMPSTCPIRTPATRTSLPASRPVTSLNIAA